MKRLAPLFPAVALALALALATVQPAAAQPQPNAATPTLNMYALLYLGDPALQKELKLSEAQIKKLNEQRDKFGLSLLGAGVDQTQRDEMNKTVEKFLADVLEPAQAKRMRQVVLQQLAKGSVRTGSRLPAIAPEVAKELKLTDDQMTKAGGPGVSLAEVLTDDQKKIWKEMTGEAFETALRISLPGGGFGRAALPTSLRYLTVQSVKDELKLSEDQAKKVAELQTKWQQDAPARPRTDEDRKKVEAMTAATETEVAKLLDAAQAKRLKQIVLQQAQAGGHEAVVFTMPEVAKELNLSDAQNTKIKSIEAERRKAMLPLFLTGENYEAIEKKVEEQKKETYTLLLAVLNDAQQKQLKEMIGEPFKGRLGGPGGFGPSGGPGFQPAAYPTYLFVTGLLYTDNKPLQEELKLSADQMKRLNELRDKSSALTRELGPPGTGGSMEEWEKKRAQQAKDNEKALADILEPKQLARFKQLILQHYVALPARGPIPSMVSRFVEVAEELKLTKQQKEQLQQGTEMAKVLDEKQQAKWKEMLGEPFEKAAELTTRPGGFGPGGPGGRFLSNTGLQYLSEKSVQDDLKLIEDQIKKLPELAQKWNELTKDAANWGRGPEFAKKMAETQAELDKAIAGVLTEKQVARLQQIELQQTQKANGLGMLLTAASVAKELKLSEDQIKKISEINTDASQTENLISNELFRVVDRNVDEDYTKTQEEFTKITEKKLNAVLTPKQHEQLKAMLGEPFKGELRFGPGGGGFGGPGGGFGGGAFPG